MQNLRKCSLFTLFLIAGICLYAQDIDGWRIDSAATIQSNAPQWKIDSAICIISSTKDKDEYSPYAQPIFNDRTELVLAGMSTLTDGNYAPFWMTNNQHGIGSSDTNKQYLRLKAFTYKKIETSDDYLGLSGGADVLASNNLSSDFYVQQLYADVSYKAAVLSVGMKERQSLFKNKDLSSGGLTLSNNARPIPQVEFGIPEFVSIPYTDEKFKIAGGLSYGWFGDDKFKLRNSADGSYAEKVLYHRKYGFLKFRPDNTWSFITGLEMDTQWGGHFYSKGEYKYKSPARLKDFFRILIPMSGGSDSNITDRVNIAGNIYGSIHFIANYRNDNLKIKAYHEHFFEDHSGLFFKNIPDGLYGIEVHLNKTTWLSDILVEYLHSKNQSGPFLWDENDQIPIQISGGDNYYNQVDYISLSNYGYVTGNPLFVSPIYNNGSSLTVYNTRLSSFHFGIAGNISSNVTYRALATYSKSWGTPLIPSAGIRNQFSGMLEATYNNVDLNGWLFSGAVAYDRSQMIGDNAGIQLKISKSFHID